MSRATHAILKHYSSAPENPRHENCPTGMWRLGIRPTYQSKIHSQNLWFKLMQPIFDWLRSEEFLIGCEKCLDQNKNECLHHVFWVMVPKEQYTSQQEASLAVALCVLVFNNGLEDTVAKLLTAMELPVSSRGDRWKAYARIRL